jgi:ATP-dependent RNA helicase DDX18/HAS1
VNKYEFSLDEVADIQPQLEELISQNYDMKEAAQKACRGYILAYDSHSLKQIYDMNTLDLNKV